ncbi:hypothetical protein [Dyella humicola]|uniref:hypothetical protein n=1 Tax=Dyella humicola TaxID=2992126 RepID=UPI0022530770|nr:hypothetical protein [Dyella humicola]
MDRLPPDVRVLIIDAHAGMRRGLHSLLDSTEDLRWVGEALDLADGLKSASRLEPDVTIVDFGAAQKFGFDDLGGHLSAHSWIVMSDYPNASKLYKAIASGAYGGFLKLSPASEILSIVRACGSLATREGRGSRDASL